MNGFNKRGQAAAGAAVLLAIIAGLLVMFIILIPPVDRAALLGDQSYSAGKPIDSSVTQRNLLTVNPGRVDYLALNEIEHPLPVVNIFNKKESKILAEKNMAYAKRGVFTEEVSEFKFSVDDLKNTRGVLLSFNVAKARGNLAVTLNNEVIFSGPVEVGNLAPLSLADNSLKQENVVTFAVSSPGAAFWRTHEVVLEDIQVVGDVTKLDTQFSKNVFLVSDTEKKNMERVVLKFQPSCTYNEVGKLLVYVNGNEVYSGVPDCDLAMVPLEFSPNLISDGQNEVVFKTEEGRYILSHVNVVSKLKEVDFPTYYFELSNGDYQSLQSKTKRLRLTSNFVDVTALKSGAYIFNGHTRNFDTKEVIDNEDLSDIAVMGSNSLKIKPKKTVEIRELRVDLVK
jgi:hypothetical protein